MFTSFTHGRGMVSSGDTATSNLERRAFERVRLDCPARLVTVGSYRAAQLCDLSRSGARLTLDKPLAEGTTALLQWSTHESFCTIVWASDIACGVAFERTIPSDWVTAAIDLSLEGDERPVAGVTKIEFGSKRRTLAYPAFNTCDEEPDEHACWTIILPRHPRRSPLTPAGMSSAEEMFFLGSPLAHVVQFQSGKHEAGPS